MRKNFQDVGFYPQPVLIVGTYDEHGVPDAMNVGWAGLVGSKYELDQLVNLSITQTMGRSIHTTVTTVLAMATVCVVCFIAGVSSIISFAFPLIIGMLAGVYSSNCIAPTLWVMWEKHKAKKGKGRAAKNAKKAQRR